MRVSGDYGILCALFAFITPALAIDCYACSSIAGDNKGCEDPFDRSLKTVHFIARDCYYGYFRGTHCYKLKGQRVKWNSEETSLLCDYFSTTVYSTEYSNKVSLPADGSSIMVRHCSDSYWGSHCGDIKYTNEHNEEEKISGCLETCDHDGCNTGTSVIAPFGLVCAAAILNRIFSW